MAVYYIIINITYKRTINVCLSVIHSSLSITLVLKDTYFVLDNWFLVWKFIYLFITCSNAYEVQKVRRTLFIYKLLQL
jgi:hypothetical protein